MIIKTVLRNCIVSAVVILITSPGSIAQLSKTDHLKDLIHQKTDKAEKLTAIFELCEYYESLPPDTFYSYALEAKQLALQLNNAEKIMKADYYEAVYLFKKNKLDSALQVTNNLIEKYKRTVAYNSMYVNLYVLKFNEYWRNNNFNDAIATSQELLKLAEEHNDTAGIIKGKVDMGAAYHIVSNQPKEGLKWYYQAFALLTDEAYKIKYSSVYQNIAIAYDDLEIKDSTLLYLKLGLQYARLGDNKTNLARALRLYGSIMADYKLVKEAAPAFREAIELQKSIGDIFGTIRAMQGEADFYSSTNNTGKAIPIYLDALALAEKNGMTLVMTYDLNQNLAAAYEQLGDFKKANEILNRMLAIKDSNYKINSAYSLAEIQTKYEVQKKETIIAQQKLDLFQRKLFLWGNGIVALLLFSYLALRFKKYNQKQKVENKIAVKDAEEIQRKRIASELHDNLGVQANAILHDSILLNDENSNNKTVVADLQETAKEMLYNLRETLWAMKTADVSATDLWLRIISFMKQMGRHYTTIDFKIEGVPPQNFTIASSQALHIVLVLQESVNNSVKHSAATTITATSTNAGACWKIIMADNGNGFDLDEATKKTDCYGLSNMRQRAEEGKFNYHIETGAGKGASTTILVNA